MEVTNSNCASLSNYEVYKHLQKIKDSRKKNIGQLATITYETLRYLESTPCVKQDTNSVNKYLKSLAPFNFTKNEKLIMVNSPPTTPLEIQLMIEESEERLTEQQVDNIINLTDEHFPFLIQKVDNQE